MDKQIECINELKQIVLEGVSLTAEEAYALGETTEREALYEAAAEITHHFGKPAFNLPWTAAAHESLSLRLIRATGT